MKHDFRSIYLLACGTLLSTSLYAQIGVLEEFVTPGVFSYQVPAGANQLQLEVAGAAGGAGGWDDGFGGSGAGGSVVKALITVNSGDTINITVAEGGEGSLGIPKTSYGVGAAGGGDGTHQTAGTLSSAIPGAGGRGANRGSLFSSPGGAGGGGASAVMVAGAAVIAGGGGGGGSNSRIFRNGDWNVTADSAINGLILNLQDPLCTALATGLAGQSGDETAGYALDGAGGSGGGGGYASHVGAGGAGGQDGRSGHNAQPGGSGGSCTLSAGAYQISNVSIALGQASATTDGRDTAQTDGVHGFVRITPLVKAPVAAPTPVPLLDAVGLMAMAGAIGAAGLVLTRRKHKR